MSSYKPKVVKARLHTARRKIKGNAPEAEHIKKANEYFDGIEVLLALWEYDNHSAWHLWSWKEEDDETVMMAIYEAEQAHPLPRYKGDFERYKEDWKNGEYDPACAYTFPLDAVEVLQVVQEEENNIDKEEVKKKVKQAKEEGFQRRRRKRAEYRRRKEKRSHYGKA